VAATRCHGSAYNVGVSTKVTIEVPDQLMQKLVEASCNSGRPIDRVILDAIADSALSMPDFDSMTEFERLQWAARRSVPPWTDEDDTLMAQVFPDDDPNAPVLTHEELWERLPKLPPDKWLSKAVIEDREDRV
jgi:hypothetical protein